MPLVNFIVSRRGPGEVSRVMDVPELPREGEVITVDGMTCRVRTASPLPGGDPFDAVVTCNELET